MNFGADLHFLEAAFFQSLGTTPSIQEVEFVGGGCINNAVKVITQTGQYFIKWNEDPANDMFEKELMGLALIAEKGSVTIPGVYGFGQSDQKNYLLLEFVEQGPTSPCFWEDFGTKLASLHRCTHQQHGLEVNNYIGRLPQKNIQKANWIDFFIENRLEVQLGLAIYNNLVNMDFVNKFRSIYPRFKNLLPDEPPSLLHGDLWSGNFMRNEDGLVCLFDPAVYYGSREMELAFTDLFGGFDPLFYASYRDSYAIQPGFQERIPIYNLYPLLVHANMFGASYLAGIDKTIKRFT